ncbi:MAG: MetQ/NlpA family ABC transporter substrate-binding protein [Treponema lecithinolyticum]|uniref:MetQ/NlpA family ABC transporter substrate-binding protein n=1 Tax=Treponema lecithinolyticum TaxID=53418 RepID=UPI003624638C
MRGVFAIGLAAAVFIFNGACAKKTDGMSSKVLSGVEGKQVLKVGATPEPHAEMLKLISKDLQNEGVRLEIIEFTDYVTPNAALESGQIDANFFQHIPYLQSFNEEQGTHLVSAGGVHIEPLALYSKKYSALEQLSDGAVIAIPNDPTNEGRSLLLLQSAQLIRLKENADITATPADIAENPKKLKFREIEAASLPRVLADTDAAVINGNYAIPAGLSAAQNGLFVEGSDSPYVNVVAVKKGNENDERIAALMQALRSEKIAAFIAERYPNGEVVKVF